MKKMFIGIAVLATLVIYSLGVRHEQPKIAAPATSTTTKPLASSNSQQSTQPNNGTYKDGSYTGSTEDAYYGNVQVQATISGGKLTGVTFLQHPDAHANSIYINKQAMPYLEQEAIKAQSAHVDIISGATYTSQAFIQSLTSALSQAS